MDVLETVISNENANSIRFLRIHIQPGARSRLRPTHQWPGLTEIYFKITRYDWLGTSPTPQGRYDEDRTYYLTLIREDLTGFIRIGAMVGLPYVIEDCRYHREIHFKQVRHLRKLEPYVRSLFNEEDLLLIDIGTMDRGSNATQGRVENPPGVLDNVQLP